MNNLTFKAAQRRWFNAVERDCLWTFYVYIDGRAYEFELDHTEEGSYVYCVTQFEGEEKMLTEKQIEQIFKEWES